MRRSQAPAQLDALDIRQSEIEEHQVGATLLDRCDGAAATSEPANTMPLVGEDSLEAAGDRVVVLDDHDLRGIAHAPTVPALRTLPSEVLPDVDLRSPPLAGR